MTLLDDERCQCQHRWAWEDPGKHEIATRIHKGLSAFCLEMFSPLNVFSPTLLELKAPLEDSNGDGMNLDKNTVALSVGKLPKKIKSRSEETTLPASKLSLIIPARMNRRLPVNGNIGWQDLRSSCADLVSYATSQDNAVQNVIFTAIVGLKKLLEEGDYGHDRHVGTTIEHIAHQLHVLTNGTSTVNQPGFPVVKSSVPRQGPNPTIRIGSEKSYMTKSKLVWFLRLFSNTQWKSIGMS